MYWLQTQGQCCIRRCFSGCHVKSTDYGHEANVVYVVVSVDVTFKVLTTDTKANAMRRSFNGFDVECAD